jgi:ribosomal protein L11 methyltransferase
MESISHQNINSVMDVGTGTGILAIAAAKIWNKAKVSGSDIEEVAIEVSKQHAFANEVDIDFKIANGLPENTEKVDLIVSNILKAPLIDMAEDFSKNINRGGAIILSGFLDYQSQDVQDAYLKAGFKEPYVINKENWITLILKI